VYSECGISQPIEEEFKLSPPLAKTSAYHTIQRYFFKLLLMTLKTDWDLPKYFYTSIDDPKWRSDVDSILPKIQAFADRWRETLGKIQSP
jgi:hypothetical protein